MRLTSLQYVFKRAQARRNVAKTVGPARGDGGATAIAGGSEGVAGFQFGLLGSENPATAQRDARRSMAISTGQPNIEASNQAYEFPSCFFGCYFFYPTSYTPTL